MCLVAGTCLRWHPSPFVWFGSDDAEPDALHGSRYHQSARAHRFRAAARARPIRWHVPSLASLTICLLVRLAVTTLKPTSCTPPPRTPRSSAARPRARAVGSRRRPRARPRAWATRRWARAAPTPTFRPPPPRQSPPAAAMRPVAVRRPTLARSRLRTRCASGCARTGDCRTTVCTTHVLFCVFRFRNVT